MQLAFFHPTNLHCPAVHRTRPVPIPKQSNSSRPPLLPTSSSSRFTLLAMQTVSFPPTYRPTSRPSQTRALLQCTAPSPTKTDTNAGEEGLCVGEVSRRRDGEGRDRRALPLQQLPATTAWSSALGNAHDTADLVATRSSFLEWSTRSWPYILSAWKLVSPARDSTRSTTVSCLQIGRNRNGRRLVGGSNREEGVRGGGSVERRQGERGG